MENILIIQTAFPGDAILTLPMIEKLKEKYPESFIDVLCIPSTSEIFSASPFIHNVIVLDKKKSHKSLYKLLKFSSELKKHGYKRIYSPHRSLRTAILVMQTGVRETYGFSNSSFPHVYKYLIDYRQNEHEVKRNLDLIGFNSNPDEWRILPKLTVSSQSQEKVRKFIAANELSGNILAVAPGTIWETKKYPERYFREIINSFVDKSFKVLIVGGKADEELGLRLASDQKNVIVTCGLFSIIETIEILKKVKILISNDSAPAHMGVCADIPVLTIYCSTIPHFGFYPYNKKSSYISFEDLKCKPCGIHGFKQCPVNTFDCGYNLSPKFVISKIEEMLNDQTE
ncbi:MAG: glycosyltransferase family 9 protein [Ignavibacteriaceae bacterium]|nr:glycosyltransferase family 9 protein [Ignavibacteriaceae bacterium]